MKLDYKKLQNGSDIRGVAIEGVAGETLNLGAEEAYRLTAAFVLWLSEKLKKDPAKLCISVGRDSRISGPELQKTIMDTLVRLGVNTLDCGMASTPAMFMSTVFPEYRCDGAIMVTASHLPYNRNGFKYFDKDGGLNKGDISTIISYAQSDGLIEGIKSEGVGFDFGNEGLPRKPQVIKASLIDTYCDNLRKMIIDQVCCNSSGNKIGGSDNNCDENPRPLEGLKIVVDAGNGAGGFYAEKILAPLGADVSASQFLEPDGTFPNHQPNPENKAAMDSICKAVLDSKADLGIIFDTDVDRSSAVDKNGHEISRNGIVAMASALVADTHPSTTIVTDSVTSDELTDFLENKLGLKHLRYKRGYKNVINKALELNAEGTDCQLAIETSGHAALKENYFLDDGAYLATKIVIKAAKLKSQGLGIETILSDLREPKEAMEKRYPITAKEFGEYGEGVLEKLKRWAVDKEEALGLSLVEPNYEGVRINFDSEATKGWCLLRKSLHDPIMPLNVEVSRGECKDILKLIEEFLSEFEELEVK